MPERTPSRRAARARYAKSSAFSAGEAGLLGACFNYSDTLLADSNIRAMEVLLYPNSRRPGVGLRPRRESQRPMLPQHARNCPVLEAGSALGFLVYPPLEPNESFHLEFQGDGRYQFVYFLLSPRGTWDALFSMT